MDTKIEEAEQKIRKVEQQIDDVEGQLTKAATEADVAYWRKKEEQLREEELQLRDEKLQLRKKEEQVRKEKLLLLKAATEEKEQLRKKEEQLREEKLLLLKAATEEKEQLRKKEEQQREEKLLLLKAATEEKEQLRKKEEQQREEKLLLLKAATEEKEQLRKKEEQQPEEKLLQLKADTSGLSSGVFEKLLQDLTEYLAKQKAKKELKKSVCLSSVSQSIWDTVQWQASLKMMYKDIKPKRWSDLPAFGWDDRLERSQADRYTVHLNKIECGRKWKLIDAANKHPTLLSGFLGDWHFKGTTDVAFVHRIASKHGVQRGLKCIFKLKKDLGGGGRDKAVIQTLICLVMANVFAQQFKPCAVLTDLHDDWSLYWMDGSTIYYFTFESRASAVGYIEELLQDSDDNEMGTSEALASYALPDGEDEDLQFIKK